MPTARAAAAVLLIAVSAMPISPAGGQEMSGCETFAWPLARERAWFTQANIPSFASGTEVAELPRSAFTIQLRPDSGQNFVMPPERKRAENGNGGVLSLTLPRDGLYQITTSNDAWIDLIQDGRYLRSAGSTGGSTCPGVRKSIRVRMAAGPLTLQVSSVASAAITLAIVLVE